MLHELSTAFVLPENPDWAWRSLQQKLAAVRLVIPDEVVLDDSQVVADASVWP